MATQTAFDILSDSSRQIDLASRRASSILDGIQNPLAQDGLAHWDDALGLLRQMLDDLRREMRRWSTGPEASAGQILRTVYNALSDVERSAAALTRTEAAVPVGPAIDLLHEGVHKLRQYVESLGSPPDQRDRSGATAYGVPESIEAIVDGAEAAGIAAIRLSRGGPMSWLGVWRNPHREALRALTRNSPVAYAFCLWQIKRRKLWRAFAEHAADTFIPAARAFHSGQRDAGEYVATIRRWHTTTVDGPAAIALLHGERPYGREDVWFRTMLIMTVHLLRDARRP